MTGERYNILNRLSDGELSVEEAAELLRAAGPDVESPPADVQTIESAPEPDLSPDMARFRDFWRTPFLIAAGILILCGFGLGSLYANSSGRITLALVCVWSFFLLASFATAITLWTRTAPWIHVRAKQKDGERVAISLPVPLSMVGVFMNIARRFAPTSVRDNLETAATMLESMEDELRKPGYNPLIVDVDDEDGERVQIYIG